ncbi:two-component system sensor histidine kinase NtrB [Hydrogenophaga sp.]|uniref:two-component system sensor histidine kinase NtrB n=1 Tax=Hydrogenophaga sp. TaxID=1904254 RepID=UPI00286E41CA|nr:ATP-binding protein [Hydrogenophaga sp.]
MPPPPCPPETPDTVVQQLDALAPHLPDAYLQWHVGPAGEVCIERVSPALWAWLGGAPPPGEPLEQAFWRRVDADGAATLHAHLAHAGQDTAWTAAWCTTGADGQRSGLQASGQPWATAAGGSRCRAFVQRAPPPQVATEARQASERRFRDLIDAIPNIAVQGYDHRMVCRFWNAASERLYGFSAEEAIGSNLLDLIIPPALRGSVLGATDRMLATGQAIASAELELQDQQGRPVHVHSGHVLLQRPDHPPEFFCIDFDLSERRQAEAARRQLEAQMRELQKMEALGTLAGGIAHDFNNILAAILGNVKLALEDTAADNPAQTSLLEIQKAGRRARALTQQILTFARRQEEQREAVDLGPLVQALQGVFRTTLPPATRLRLEVGDGLPTVLANATQIQQVLINLVANAVQACMGQQNALVTVQVCAADGPPPIEPGALAVLQSRTAPAGAGVQITVRDNGSGMAPDVAAHIFEPFFTTKAAQKGTGLGLSVVHGILNDHDASLQLITAPGQGSCFRLWFAATAAPGTAG